MLSLSLFFTGAEVQRVVLQQPSSKRKSDELQKLEYDLTEGHGNSSVATEGEAVIVSWIWPKEEMVRLKLMCKDS